MSISTWVYILVGLLLLGMIVWMVGTGNKTAEAPTATTTTIIIGTTTPQAGSTTMNFPDNGEEKWTK